jgi:hypothetical protein
MWGEVPVAGCGGGGGWGGWGGGGRGVASIDSLGLGSPLAHLHRDWVRSPRVHCSPAQRVRLQGHERNFSRKARHRAGIGSLGRYLEVYPQLPVAMRPLEIVQQPGEIIYVPSGWWHMVPPPPPWPAPLARAPADFSAPAGAGGPARLRTLLRLAAPTLSLSHCHI